MFSAHLIHHNDGLMLNICDADLLGKTLNRGNFTLKISEKYYAEKVVDKEEAKDLLKRSNSINMVGKEIISLSVNMNIGSREGVKEIDGIPFLIVFKM
jgi:hypothetical protein